MIGLVLWLTIAEARADFSPCEFPHRYESERHAGFTPTVPIDQFCPDFVLFTERGDRVHFDFSRLTGAQYMIAGQGAGAASRFGHAMLRLTFCAPDQTFPCAAEDFYSLTFGFAAQSEALNFKLSGGLKGRYPSLLTLNADTDLRARYTHDQLRDIRAYPLNLNRDELRGLWAQLTQTFWVHQASYRFLSNNCASEILKLLGTLWPDLRVGAEVKPQLLTPAHLLRHLRRVGRVDPAGAPTRLEWKSPRQELLETLNQIVRPSRPLRLADYVRAPARVRLAWILKSRNSYDNLVLFRLEDLAVKAAVAWQRQRAVQILNEDASAPAAALRHELEEAIRSLTPSRLQTSGRQIVPSLDQLVADNEIRARRRHLTGVIATINIYVANDLRVHHAALEVEAGRRNLVTLKQRSAWTATN